MNPLPPQPPKTAAASRRNTLLALITAAEKGFARAVADVVVQADNVLYDLAEAEVQSLQQNALLDVRVTLRNQRDAIGAAFAKKLHVAAQQLMPEVRNAASAAAPQGPSAGGYTQPDALSLVGDDALQAALTVKGLAAKLLDKLERELALLTARVGVLTANPDMVVPDNPIAPAAVLTALDEAMAAREIAQRERQHIWIALSGLLQPALESVYQDLNEVLAGEGVLPDLKPGFVKRTAPKEAKPSAAGDKPKPPIVPPAAPAATQAGQVQRPAAAWPQQSVAPATAPPATRAGGLGVDAALAGMARRKAAAPVPTGSAVVLPYGGGAALVSHAEMLFAGHPDAVPRVDAGALWMVPTRQVAFWGALDGWMPTAVDFAVSLGAPAPRGYGVGLPPGARPHLWTPSVLWRAREAPAAAELSEIESLTIDIVAMLFDHVFDDENISIPIKALLARLQVPVLKLAMNDRGFFSNRDHPARVLLDELARVGMGCGPNATRSDPIYAQIEGLVDQIARAPGLSGAAVRTALATFLAEAQSLEREGEAFIEQSQRVASERAAREAARSTAEAAVVARTAEHLLPPEVRQLLEQTWPQVMMRAFARGGEESPAWQDALTTVEDLVWSLAPKNSSQDRNRMLSVLPSLLRRLQDGINVVGLDPASRDRFFNVLVDCHSRAMDVDRESDPAAANYADWLREIDRKARASAPQVPAMERLRVSELGVRIEEIRLKLRGRITPPLASLGIELQEPQLSVGQWVEFHDDDALNNEVLRAKLTWVSPLAHVYLFTNPQLGEAISISQTALAAQIMAGVTRLLDDSPVTDRAVGGVKSTLGIATSVAG